MMSSVQKKILVFTRNSATISRLPALGIDARSTLVPGFVATWEEMTASLAADAWDGIIVVGTPSADNDIDALRAVRRLHPNLPVIALIPAGAPETKLPECIDEQLPIAALSEPLLTFMIDTINERHTTSALLGKFRREDERTATIFSILSGLAHNLNNPLCGISGHVQLQLMNEEIEPDLNQMFTEMLTLTKKMGENVRFLHALVSSRTEPTTTFMVHEMVAKAVAEHTAAASFKNITLTADLSGAVVLEGRRNVFQKAIGHLIENSIDATDPGGTIAVKTFCSDTRCTIIVSDTGMGMTDEVQHHAFTPLFTTKNSGNHKGLGLCLLRSVVDHYKGAITLKSAEGAGAVFTIEIPVWS
jgi:signal transduction histidine kinase